MNQPDPETMKRRATGAAARSRKLKTEAPTPPARVAPVVMVEHRACGVSFPRNESCPECGRQLLEG